MIAVDYREEKSGIIGILEQEYGIEVVKDNLKAGDYLISNEIIIERKTTLDFGQSIVDGRLFRQTLSMKQHFDRCLLIIEGNSIYETTVKIHHNAIKGALVSLAVVWQVPVLFTKDIRDTALVLKLISEQEKSIYSQLSYRWGRRPKKFRNRQLYILQGLPYVGPKLAVRLLDTFCSIEKVITAKKEDLMGIEGLGKGIAGKIKEVVS